MNKCQEIFGRPAERTEKKVRAYMVNWVMSFIENSPFMVLSTCDSQGSPDASPRGGKPGFVKIINNTTLILPDVAGNKLFQSYENMEGNPNVGMLFFIPGENSMVRINGSAQVVRPGNDEYEKLELNVFSPEENRKLIQAIVVTVSEAYSHCPRAVSYSKLWDTEKISSNIESPKIPKWKPGT